MALKDEEREYTRAEKILAAATVIFLYLATLEALNMISKKYLWGLPWEKLFYYQRIIYYGISIPLAIFSIVLASRLKGWKRIYGNIFMAYGLLTLITSVGRFIFDCLPEVAVALAGAAGSGFGIWYLRRKYYTAERIADIRIRKGYCPECGKGKIENGFYCPICGSRIAYKCENCGYRVVVRSKYCPNCGSPAGKS